MKKLGEKSMYCFMERNTPTKIRQGTFKSLIRFICFSLVADNLFVLFLHCHLKFVKTEPLSKNMLRMEEKKNNYIRSKIV